MMESGEAMPLQRVLDHLQAFCILSVETTQSSRTGSAVVVAMSGDYAMLVT